MIFTKKDVRKYIEKKEKYERDLADECAFGNASKTTLRKIEELNCIINYNDLLELSKDQRRKIMYYEELLKRHNISYLK